MSSRYVQVTLTLRLAKFVRLCMSEQADVTTDRSVARDSIAIVKRINEALRDGR